MTKDTNTKDIFYAVWNNDIEAVKTYINNGGDVNVKCQYGKMPLMRARSLEMARLLLDAGADVDARDDDGKTVLMLTANAQIAKLLKSHCAVA